MTQNDLCWKIILSQDTTRSHWTCFVDEAFVLELSQTDFLERTFLIFLLFDTNSKRFKGEGEEVGKDRRGLRKLLREGESDGFKRISHARTHTRIHTHTLSHPLTLSITLSHTHVHSFSIPLSLKHIIFFSMFFKHTHTHYFSLPLSLSHALIHFSSSLSLTYTHSFFSLSIYLSHTHAHTLSSYLYLTHTVPLSL